MVGVRKTVKPPYRRNHRAVFVFGKCALVSLDKLEFDAPLN